MCCVPSLFCNLYMCVCVHCTWLYVVCCKVYTCIKPIIEWLKGPGSDLQTNTLRTHAHGAYVEYIVQLSDTPDHADTAVSCRATLRSKFILYGYTVGSQDANGNDYANQFQTYALTRGLVQCSLTPPYPRLYLWLGHLFKLTALRVTQ